jgi:hypothetical protein
MSANKTQISRANKAARSKPSPMIKLMWSTRPLANRYQPEGGAAPHTPTTSQAKDSVLTLARRTGSEKALHAGSFINVL